MLPEEQVDEEEQAREDEAAEEKDEASLEELIARKSQKTDADEEDESILSADRDERGGTLPGKVAPQQATEFVCKKCFLVKHQSQLADKKRMLCKDCA